MSSNVPGPAQSRATKVIQVAAEVAIVATLLLWVPLLNDLGQTTTLMGVSMPTAILVAIFWVLGVIGGGIFTFRWR
jgi:hypothetical protein